MLKNSSMFSRKTFDNVSLLYINLVSLAKRKYHVQIVKLNFVFLLELEKYVFYSTFPFNSKVV